jgi:ATP-dependent protease HslVU (ClpYQ) peptidase subunit
MDIKLGYHNGQIDIISVDPADVTAVLYHLETLLEERQDELVEQLENSTKDKRIDDICSQAANLRGTKLDLQATKTAINHAQKLGQ